MINLFELYIPILAISIVGFMMYYRIFKHDDTITATSTEKLE